MKGPVLAIFTCMLIIMSPFALAQEEEGVGFVARVKAFFGADAPAQAPEPSAESIEASCRFREHLCAGAQGNVLCAGTIEECLQRHGRCACGTGGAREQEQPGEGTTVPAQAGQQMRDERVPGQAIVNLPPVSSGTCSPCDAVVCSDGDGEFVCPSSLRSCVARFGESCRALRCREDACPGGAYLCAAEERAMDPPSVVPSSPEVVSGGVQEGAVVPGTATTRARSGALVRCEGSYEECSAKYGSCGCAGSGDACVFDGRKYPVGESFPSSDGCNTCMCARDGTIACTQRACAGTCGNGICEDTERVGCVQVCPECRPGTPAGQCACVMRCPQVCPQDCGESDGRIRVGSGTVIVGETAPGSATVSTTA